MTTNKPAMSLPLTNITFDSDGQFRVSGCNATNEDKHAIADRANACTKLVEALRELLGARDLVRVSVQHFHKNRAEVSRDAKAAANARSILRELGEI
jgi:hypothetical protein